MKFSRLLVLSALWLLGLGANAADLIDRTEPETPALGPGNLTADDEGIVKTATEFVVGDAYVIYNVQAGKYFTEGNSWGTQASVGETPLLVRFTLPDGKSLADNALLFNDYPNTKNTWKLVFFDSATAMFVDRGSQDNYFWQVVPQGNNNYYLQASPANPTLNPANNDGYVGLDVTSNEANTALSPFLAEGEGHYITWQFYAVPAWTNYFKEQDIYNKAQELKTAIEAAEEEGIDVSQFVAVYNNEGATLADLQAAIDGIQQARANRIANGTAENPTNATPLITNPNFDNASAAGWSGTSPNMSGDGNHAAANVAEQYNKTFDTYQTVSGLPAGVYMLTARTFFRGTMEDYLNNTNLDAYPYLYASVNNDTLSTRFNNAWSAMNTESYEEIYGGTTEFGTPNAEGSTMQGGVTYYIPNNPSTFRLYCENGDYYQTKLFFDATEGKANIGVKKDKKVPGSNSDWAVFDTFGLTYYGNSPASYQKWVELSIPTLPENAVVTASYIEEFNSTVAGLTATNRAEALAALAQAEEAAAKVQENISAWSKYQAKVAEADQMRLKEVYAPFADALGDYLDMDVEDILDALELTTEELLAEIAKLDEMMEAVKEAAKNAITPGADVTETYLENADFEAGNAGWLGASSITAFSAGCAEAFEKNPFDLYQVVKNPQVGVYEISLQGFYRLGSNDQAYASYKAAKANGTEEAPVAWVYLNSNRTPLNNVYDIEGQIASNDFFSTPLVGPAAWAGTDNDGNTWYFPNGMSTSSDCFNVGYYQKSAYGLVQHQGDSIRIGITGNLGSSNWAIWDNFKLVYRGYEADVIKPILEETIAGLDMDRKMGKSIYEEMTAAIAAAKAAITENDGTKMFQALSNLFTLRDKADQSVALFAELIAANEELVEVYSGYTDSPYANDAIVLYETIDDGITNHEYEDADVEGLMAQINEMITKLKLPAYADASDLNPIDMTVIIKTPDFEIDGANSVDGWHAEGYNFGNDDTQKGAFALEYFNKTFDIYQDIVGLPNGTYDLTVQAFCRIGSTANDYEQFTANENASEAHVYAISGDVQSSVPVACLFKGAVTEDPGISGQTTYTPEGSEVTYYIPNDMVSAVAFFEAEESGYTNKVTFKVTDNKVHIGMKKGTNTDNGWVLLDSWRLTYYGENSSKQADGDISAIAEVSEQPVVSVEFFTLDGRKATAAQKGIMIQKATLGNGAVLVRKIQK